MVPISGSRWREYAPERLADRLGFVHHLGTTRAQDSLLGRQSELLDRLPDHAQRYRT